MASPPPPAAKGTADTTHIPTPQEHTTAHSPLPPATAQRRPRSRITFSFANSLMGSFTDKSSVASHSSAAERNYSSDVEWGNEDGNDDGGNDDGTSIERRSSSRGPDHIESISLHDEMIENDGRPSGIRMERRPSHSRTSSQDSNVSSDSQKSGDRLNNVMRLFSSRGNSKETEGTTPKTLKRHRSAVLRRYNVKDLVLISNHNENSKNLVNILGFAEWDTEALTLEERRGPYVYLLAEVKSVHFLADAPYYTVVRLDNQEEMRADVEYMEPITTLRNIEAAKRAAQKGSRTSGITNITNVRWNRTYAIQNRIGRCTQSLCNQYRRVNRKIKRQVEACLNGNRPYSLSCRFTGVNLLVTCHFWYLFVDQLRLAFAPNSVDEEFAVVSFVVWLILLFELIFEVYTRPSDYSSLIRSEKAYLPSTVRHISNFHIWTEFIALVFFIPEFLCLFDSISCGYPRPVSLTNACLMALYGPDRKHSFYGLSFLCIMRLRMFGLVRHWEKMWVNNTFVRVKGKDGTWTVERGRGLFIPQGRLHAGKENAVKIEEQLLIQAKSEVDDDIEESQLMTSTKKMHETHTDDYHLINATKIGTALLTTNAQRGLILIFFVGLQSLFSVFLTQNGGINQQPWTSVEILQRNNIAINATDSESCTFFAMTVSDWIASNLYEEQNGNVNIHLLSFDIQPVRCKFQEEPLGSLGGAICNSTKLCLDRNRTGCKELCVLWPEYTEEERRDTLMRQFDVRQSMTVPVPSPRYYGSYSLQNETVVEADFYVDAVFNESLSVEQSILDLFILQLGFTIFILLSLSILRYDAGRLVLGPLRRMLKIVAAYSTNPLAPPPQTSSGSFGAGDNPDKLGQYETEQLINTVTKITDLLRKCWGVAGAGIISSNLARQEGGLTAYFNPTVPGKAVYALFAFVAIDNFKSYLHCLQGDIMILINDVAAILHEEVYRWGYEDRGQCNKNLGSAFLMVYKIGAVSEVMEKRKQAEQVIFSSSSTPAARRQFTHNRIGSGTKYTPASNASSMNGWLSRSHVDNIDLSSLPGIQTFADRALLGLLKTFAGIHRDKTILNWNDDFRLGAGVRNVSVELFFGMDAGWAVEGAVGSLYKIDATYLSPHVNMASRMMSATKQYGVFILLSQKVEELLSINAQRTLRHIDTVTVKGSSVKQKIFTYDMKVRSDFFLYSKTESQSDMDSERYSPLIWNNDQDLCAMRNHVSEEFLDAFNKGRDEYLSGKNWEKAIALLKLADKLMAKREVDEGYSSSAFDDSVLSLTNVLNPEQETVDSDEYNQRLAMGDGPCQRLISYMLDFEGKAPADWAGYRPLTSK